MPTAAAGTCCRHCQSRFSLLFNEKTRPDMGGLKNCPCVSSVVRMGHAAYFD